MSTLADEFGKLGYSAKDVPNSLVQVDRYQIHLGRHKGECVDIALTSTDFPTTPPAGLHVHAPWGDDRPNTSQSPMGDGWRYFSRRLPGWEGRNKMHVLIAYVNKVLGDA